VEGLHEEIDFKVKVSRSELEELVKDYFDHIEAPIKQALSNTNVTVVGRVACIY
jgi:hypoxia up-regulated 1